MVVSRNIKGEMFSLKRSCFTKVFMFTFKDDLIVIKKKITPVYKLQSFGTDIKKKYFSPLRRFLKVSIFILDFLGIFLVLDFQFTLTGKDMRTF